MYSDTLNLLFTPLFEWEKKVQIMRPGLAHQHIQELDSVIERAVLLREYLSEWRDATHEPKIGATSFSHDRAVKKANRTRAAVRKALRYTYPDAGEVSW